MILAVLSFVFVTGPVLTVYRQVTYDAPSVRPAERNPENPFAITPRVAMASHSSQVLPVFTENTLVIPKIGVQTKILEGKSISILSQGIWHRPHTGEPEKGNMVLAGHRYKWTSGPNTFYHLPELVVGDLVRIYWQEERFDYEVTQVFEVDSSAVDIEAQKGTEELTLYTCTLLTAQSRIVVKAKRVDLSEHMAVK